MEEQAVQEEIREIEYIASDEFQVSAIQRYMQELPDKYPQISIFDL